MVTDGTAEQEPSTAEREFARNLRAARQNAVMSQLDLARHMSARGWPWRQTTVSKVEAASRPIRLGEALSLCEIFGSAPGLLPDLPNKRPAAGLDTAATARKLAGIAGRLADEARRLGDSGVRAG